MATGAAASDVTSSHRRINPFPLKVSGNGLMHGKEFGIGRPYPIKIRRIWHRSTAKNMPLTMV